jgi:tetratricopeptide (TPR) repeat protein
MASSSPRRRITRKDLRQPDEFVSFIESAANYIANHLGRIIAAVAGVLVLLMIAFGIRFYRDYQDRIVAEAFYKAGALYSNKRYATAAVSFAEIAADYPNTSLGRLSWLCTGDAQLAQRQPGKAREAFEQYLDRDNRPEFRQLALMQFGVASEDLGDYKTARSAYQRAAEIRGTAQGRAFLDLARLMRRAGDNRGAIAVYQRLLREYPDVEEREAATDELAQLGAAPARPASPAKTISLPAN